MYFGSVLDSFKKNEDYNELKRSFCQHTHFQIKKSTNNCLLKNGLESNNFTNMIINN